MARAIEEAASKAMGALKKGQAALKGQKGVFSHLMKEHGEVTALMLRVRTSSDPKVRAELFPEIRQMLLSHERAEVQVIYTALREHVGGNGAAEDHDREANELEDAIDEVQAMGYDDPSWDDAFEELVELVARHTTEEERNWFPMAQTLLGEARAHELMEPYERVKALAKSTM